MFTNKDYRTYLEEAYKLEKGIKEDCMELRDLVMNPEDKEVLSKIIETEIDHMKLLKEMKDLI